jgi:magnesium chelatase family protein
VVIRVKTVAFQGIEAQSVEVQIQLQSGLPAFNIVGLADKTVAEARERIRAAIYSMGLAIPAKRITINLAPADLQKRRHLLRLTDAYGALGRNECYSFGLLG